MSAPAPLAVIREEARRWYEARALRVRVAHEHGKRCERDDCQRCRPTKPRARDEWGVFVKSALTT